jgi:hypothetical protein
MNRTFEYNQDLSTYSYQITDFDNITTDDYFEAVDKTLEDIFIEMSANNLEKIAICLSGIDSEIIADRSLKYKKDVEYFFLHIVGVNDEHKIIVENISAKHKVKLNLISVTFNELLDNYLDECLDICHLARPTYSSIPYLIKMIPKEFFIIIGEGDLEKDNIDIYRSIFKNRILNYDNSRAYVPMHLSEISYTLAMKKYEKIGESNFYSRKFDTWYHVLRDTRLITNHRFYYDPKSEFLYEICNNRYLSPMKTLNYNFKSHMKLIKSMIEKAERRAPKNWTPFMGDLVSVPKDLFV